MNNNDVIEKVGISRTGYSDAVKNVVMETNKENKVHWFEVLEQRGRIDPNGNIEFQVIVRIGV